jgi:hypothetical protein
MDSGPICRVGSVAVVLIATVFSELRHHGAPSGMIRPSVGGTGGQPFRLPVLKTRMVAWTKIE